MDVLHTAKNDNKYIWKNRGYFSVVVVVVMRLFKNIYDDLRV